MGNPPESRGTQIHIRDVRLVNSSPTRNIASRNGVRVTGGTTQKIAKPLEQETVRRILWDLTQWHLHAPIAEDVLGAIGLQQQHSVSFWDAMILWSAQQLGCDIVWSENLGDGQRYGDIQVVNPFTREMD